MALAHLPPWHPQRTISNPCFLPSKKARVHLAPEAVATVTALCGMMPPATMWRGVPGQSLSRGSSKILLGSCDGMCDRRWAFGDAGEGGGGLSQRVRQGGKAVGRRQHALPIK